MKACLWSHRFNKLLATTSESSYYSTDASHRGDPRPLVVACTALPSEVDPGSPAVHACSQVPAVLPFTVAGKSDQQRSFDVHWQHNARL